MEGTPFGHYQLLSLLGRGGMGEVWRAYDTLTDRIVAIKVLPANLVNDEAFEQRFRREARTAAGLNDPHVVPIHQFGEIDGRLYVDMRLIKGRDLHTIIAEHPLDATRAVMVIEQIAAALNAAHDAGLVHRDVKPSNILIGEFDFAYLIDFGIARATGDTGLTGTGNMVGTWAYMAPERFTTDEIDSRSDIYALACILHESLTGLQPYPGTSVEQQVAAHLTTPPPRPSVARPGVPAAFDDVIAQGMAKNPAERYATTVELARDARAALTAPIPTPPTPPPYTNGTPSGDTPRPVRRDTPAPASTLAAAEDDGPDEPPRDTNPPLAQPTPPPDTPKRSRFRRGIVIPVLVAVVVLVGGAVVTTTHFMGSPPPPENPIFQGTFTTAYGPQTRFDGRPRDGTIASSTWVVRSACTANGCVATATTINRPQGALTRIFDYIDGEWVAITDEPGRNPCTDVDSQRWERTALKSGADGTLIGDFSSAYENGCSTTSTVTYTRTGEPDPSAQLTDPATVPARINNPAKGFRGNYQLDKTDSASGKAIQSDWQVMTMCLRSGDRCLSFLTEHGGFNSADQLIFAEGKWTGSSSSYSNCPSGDRSHHEYTATLPLPQASADPIVRLTGQGSDLYTGGCAGTNAYDVVYQRTGE